MVDAFENPFTPLGAALSLQQLLVWSLLANQSQEPLMWQLWEKGTLEGNSLMVVELLRHTGSREGIRTRENQLEHHGYTQGTYLKSVLSSSYWCFLLRQTSF